MSLTKTLAAIGATFALLLAVAPDATAQPVLKTRGLWVQFERRGWSSEYWPGQVIQQFNQFDSVIGHNVSDEVALQLDAMKAMGVNTITIELRTADPTSTGTFVPPSCNIPPVLGFQWPQPTVTELTNLQAFLDLVQGKGFRVILGLTNTHMEEQPPTNSQLWLGAILGAIKSHPALDFVAFNGDQHTYTVNGVPRCGIPAEPPLWLGPSAVPATYVKWAIGYAMSLGFPASQLSAEAVVGDFFTDSQPPAGPDATDGHLWSPIKVLKAILDALGIPNNQRVYALSFYEHRKCLTAQNLPCVDADPATWADQTLQGVYNTIGTGNGARVVAAEMGNNSPVDPNWSTPSALANLIAVLGKYGADGGSFWRWTSFMNSEDSDSTLATPIKRRGTDFTYNPVQATLANAYMVAPDTTPNVFGFSAQTGVLTGGTATSSSVIVSGINMPSTISISTGGSYSVSGGDFTSAAGTVQYGDSVLVRLTASNSVLTTACATLTIGGVSGQFCATTGPNTAEQVMRILPILLGD